MMEIFYMPSFGLKLIVYFLKIKLWIKLFLGRIDYGSEIMIYLGWSLVQPEKNWADLRIVAWETDFAAKGSVGIVTTWAISFTGSRVCVARTRFGFSKHCSRWLKRGKREITTSLRKEKWFMGEEHRFEDQQMWDCLWNFLQPQPSWNRIRDHWELESPSHHRLLEIRWTLTRRLWHVSSDGNQDSLSLL